jgi:predicted YcjX-like family ATPase
VPEIRLAVSGLANAGKTVFITQLVSHLEHFKRSHFDLGKGRTITDVKVDVEHVAQALPGVQPFPYAEARKHLLGRDPDWPPATRQVTGIRVEFTLVDEDARLFKRSRYGLEVYDFPGELLGDLNLPDRSFDAWSEETLRRLRDPVSPLRVAGWSYLPGLEHLHDTAPATLVRRYHEALEAAVQQGATSVTPGGWIYARGSTVQQMPLVFAPLPSSAPQALRNAFAAEFEAYRRWLSPLIAVFCQCDRHAILVDVLEILRGGQGRYVERKVALQELIRFYAQAHGLLQRVARDLATRLGLPVMPSRTPLARAVVVATKADTILEEDRGRLAGLLQEMLENEFKTLDTKLDFRACAAYDATRRETDGQRWVITGRLPSDPAEARPRAVARVPMSWPDQAWDGSDFRALRTYLPPMPPEPIREDATFPHINLNEIFRALLDLT